MNSHITIPNNSTDLHQTRYSSKTFRNPHDTPTSLVYSRLILVIAKSSSVRSHPTSTSKNETHILTDLAKAPGFSDHHLHAGWALIEFDTTADAQAARHATHGKKYNGSILDVSFKAALTAPQNPATSNALFCEGIFEATPEEFNEVFEGYDGFRSARLCE